MSLLRFFNRQRAVVLDKLFLRRLLRSLLEAWLDHQDYQLGVHFIGASEMARLNETFLGHGGSTDVITFDHQDQGVEGQLYGEIFISIDDALIYASRFRVPWQYEVTRYLIHGILHLEGFDDTHPAARRAMKRRENRLLKELSTRFDLAKMNRQ